jgi:predicted outer membrane lipoprotein
MLNKLKRGGILGLVLAAAMAVLQPVSAQAAERHDRDGYNGRARVERSWNRDRGGWDRRDHRGWDRGRRDRGYVYYNYTPAPRYGYDYYAYPSDGYAYGGYAGCPR